MLPRVESYKCHPVAIAMRLDFGSLAVWFSFNTAVAFRTPETGLVVRENCFGPTTGRHLAMIEAQEGGRGRRTPERVSTEEFERLFAMHAPAAAFAEKQELAR